MTAVLGLIACSWHIGRAPSTVPAARPRVESFALAEPGLEVSLNRALLQACGARLDTQDGPELLLRLDRAEVVGLASGGTQAREAQLTLTLSLLADPPSTVQVQGAQAFVGATPTQLEAARRQAFDELSERLVDQAVESLLVLP